MSTQQIGVRYPTPAMVGEFFDCDATLVFNWTLEPLQTQIALQQPISSEGDFYLCGIQATSVTYQRPDLIQLAATFQLRVSDDLGYKLMSDYIPSQFFSPTFGNPYPYVIRPSHLFKAGTRVSIDIQETSNVTNVIQIAFRGRYRYRLSDVKNIGKLPQNIRTY